MNIEKLVRKNIITLKPYSSARDEFKGSDAIFLDANENPFGNLNRYPDPKQIAVKEKLSAIKNVPLANIFLGNGSDEVIDIAFRIFCEPGVDKALCFTPTYGMYDVSANINNVELVQLPLLPNFQIDIDKAKQVLQEQNIKLIFICSPNNPTGNNIEGIEELIANFEGIVFIDEAYIDFTNAVSFAQKINKYNNIIVSQTLSKAWGLAAIRMGIAFASEEIINLYNKVKPPYNISLPNQQAALQALAKVDDFNSNLNEIITQRAVLIGQLQQLPIIETVYPTDANFVLVKVADANLVYNKLVEQGVIARNRHTVLQNCIRITVGTKAENAELINALKNM
jgi:histidinol-phosphate aminotransferase